MFSKNVIGLDIADHTIEIVELRQSLFSRTLSMVSQARMSLEKGIVERGRLMNKKLLSEALEMLWQKSSPAKVPTHTVVVGIPERQVYTHILHFEESSNTSISRLINERVYETIPIEKEDLVFSSKIISKKDGYTDVLVYGTSREVLEEWNSFFEGGAYRVLSFDHELLALVRGLFGPEKHEPTCIVDCGAERTKIIISSSRGLDYVHSLEFAGDFFTEQIAKSLDISREEADRVKREEGLELFSRLAMFEKILQPIIEEINVACSFYEKNADRKIARIVLVGGSARLKGFPEYIAERTQRSVRRGSSFLSGRVNSEATDSLHYIEAFGLALKGVQPAIWEREHPSFYL